MLYEVITRAAIEVHFAASEKRVLSAKELDQKARGGLAGEDRG